jgi:hypothetical protein
MKTRLNAGFSAPGQWQFLAAWSGPGFPDHQLSAIMRLEVSYGEKETI